MKIRKSIINEAVNTAVSKVLNEAQNPIMWHSFERRMGSREAKNLLKRYIAGGLMDLYNKVVESDLANIFDKDKEFDYLTEGFLRNAFTKLANQLYGEDWDDTDALSVFYQLDSIVNKK